MSSIDGAIRRLRRGDRPRDGRPDSTGSNGASNSPFPVRPAAFSRPAANERQDGVSHGSSAAANRLRAGRESLRSPPRPGRPRCRSRIALPKPRPRTCARDTTWGGSCTGSGTTGRSLTPMRAISKLGSACGLRVATLRRYARVHRDDQARGIRRTDEKPRPTRAFADVVPYRGAGGGAQLRSAPNMRRGGHHGIAFRERASFSRPQHIDR